jgi:hypothetical protein
MTGSGEGLLAAWLQVPVQNDEEFNDWYNSEHLLQISSPEGFLSARRYRAIGQDEPSWYLALYDLAGPQTYFGPPFQAILAGPTPWSKRMARLYGPNRVVNVYRKILQLGAEPEQAAPFLFMAQMNIDPASEGEFHDWYNHEHAPRLAGVPGCLRVRRFVAEQGAPRFAAIYELASLAVLESEAWVEAREYGRTQAMRQRMSDVVRNAYQCIHVLR